MTKRTLALHSERLTELTADELAGAVAAAQQASRPCISDITGVTGVTGMPTVPDLNRCPTLFC